MKLAEHVDKIRELIEVSYDKNFARLGFGKNNQIDINKIPDELKRRRLRFEELLNSHIGETGNYELARVKLIDELTFTLFNRLAAIKVMEAASLFPPVLTKQAEHGDRSFGHKAWLEIYPHMRSQELEGIRDYIKYSFDILAKSLPLYSKEYPYALLPDAISLNEIIDAINNIEKDIQVESDIWLSDDVLGWLYESYNNKKKQDHKDSGDKTEYNKVSLQSQVYTPRWVVKFLVENSLGKLYLEMYPDSKIKQNYKIANAPLVKEREIKKLHEIKIIDPACGSGNFLLYAFDFFYALYMDQIENYDADYDEKHIPKLIIKNNLHGIDLDDRAVQMAQIGLFIKAKKKNRSIGEVSFNIVSSDFYLPEYEEVENIFKEGKNLDREQQKLIKDIWSDLQFAYKFGSLIRLDEKLKSRLNERRNLIESGEITLWSNLEFKQEEDLALKFFNNLKTAVEKFSSSQGSSFLSTKTRDAITYLELLTTEYDVATANPPYTDSSNFGPELKDFIESNYKKPHKFHINLYAAFIKRCYDFTGIDGKIAMIHPHTFMFIKSFEDVRKFMIEKSHIDVMVDYGLDRVNLFGPGILLDATFYVLSKSKSNKEGLYFNLTNNLQEKFKKGVFIDALNNYISDIKNNHIYMIEQEKLKKIDSWPFIYWISDGFREKFDNSMLDDYLKVCSGLSTANNFQFLRYWWEVGKENISANYQIDNKKWVNYCKGGEFNKWAGNIWLCVNFTNNGDFLKSNGGTLRNKDFYFMEGITCSGRSSSKGVSYRYFPENHIFDVGATGLIPVNGTDIYYGLGFINSKLSIYIISCFNPTVNTTEGDLKRIPYVNPEKNLQIIISKYVKTNIDIKEQLLGFSVIEKNYYNSPINFNDSKDIKLSIIEYLNYENHLLTQILINETIINEMIFSIYDLSEQDKTMVLEKEGGSLGKLPVLIEARDAYLAEIVATKDFPLDSISDYIKSIPLKEFNADEREVIEIGFSSLYQNNNDLEEFCIRNQINPINLWYWFKKSNVIPQQRMHTVAMEFLIDIVREILMEDDDGIIPLVQNAGEKILIDRIEEKFREKGFSNAQYSSFENILGRPINEYINKYFFKEFSDHLNLFMHLPKTPFIWHLSSGVDQGFDCYIIIYKWSRDKLMRLRSVYIEHRERALNNRSSDIAGKLSAESQNEKDLIFRQLEEIKIFKTKIDELLAEDYNPILDDGVGKNIAHLQKKKMITYEVLNEGQLQKYLNADW